MCGNHKKILIILSILFLAITTASKPSFAADTQPSKDPVKVSTLQKDSDLDGVTDKAELEKYKTNPYVSDTDQDGVIDSQEILDKTDPLNASSNKINLTIDYLKKTPTMWYLGRIAGIASFSMFTYVICLGLLMTSKVLLKVKAFGVPGVLDSHQFTATFIAFSFLILHIGAFIFDDYFQLQISEALVPFLFNREFTAALDININIPIALGVIAFYLALMLILTSQFRKKFVSVKIWRKLHYLSFLFYILFFVHGVLTGSDSKQVWMIAIYAISGVLVFSLILLRIFGKKFFLPKVVVAQEIKNDNKI